MPGNVLLLIIAIDAIIFRREFRTLSTLKVERDVQKTEMFVDDTVRVRLKLANNSLNTTGVLEVIEELPRGLRPLTMTSFRLRLSGTESSDLEYDAAAEEMGYLHFKKVIVQAFDRLGLFSSTLDFEMETCLRIFPKVPGSPSQGLLLDRSSPAFGGQAILYRRAGQDFSGIREYYPGDDHRLIAWKAMAKSSTHVPLTKEFEEERSLDFLFILQNRKSMSQGLPGRRKIDTCVGAALALAQQLQSNGDRFSILVGRERRIEKILGNPIRISEQIHDIPLDRDIGLDQFVDQVLGSTRTNSMIIVMTDAPFPSEVEVSELQKLKAAGHHVEIVLLETLTFTESSRRDDSTAQISKAFLRKREQYHFSEQVKLIRARGMHVHVATLNDVTARVIEAVNHGKGETAS